MKITLSPQRREDSLQVIKQGDTLTINGTSYDFSVVPDGATLPKDAVDCPWLTSDVERIEGVLHLTLLIPHGPNAPEGTRFPAPLVNPTDGVLELPPYNTPVVAEDEELTE
jgi:hypothetical protein